MADPEQRIDALEARIAAGDDIAAADQQILTEFSETLPLHRSEIGAYRHAKLLRHLTILAEAVGGVADALEDRDAAENLVRYINRTYDNEETNRDYRLALRALGRFCADGGTDEPPEALAWIPAGTSSNYDPTPDPAEMLRWEEDVQPMLDACHNNRDRAMIAVAFDAGLRAGEFKSLTVGDVADADHGLTLSVDGKRGQRSVTLIPSVTQLNRWLADHPAGDDPAAPLWCGLHDGNAISDRMFGKVLDSAADRAGVTRPVTLTNFRKSSASFLASRGMSQAHLENHHGWKTGSEAAARYITVFGEAAERELARIHGRDVSREEPDPIGPIPCPRCDKETPRDRDECVWCGQMLDAEAAQERSERKERLRESIRNADRDELVDALLAADRTMD